MTIQEIGIGNEPPEDINVIVEVPSGGEPVKYEMDKATGRLIVDRILFTSMRYPGNYGFVPGTLAEDNDPIDVLVVAHQQFVPASVVNCRPIGVLLMHDEAGPDEKIVAVPSTRVSAIYKGIKDYKDLPEIQLQQIVHFFQHYKELESSKWVRVDGWGDAEAARELITKAIDRLTCRNHVA
ncbi:MAG: inorganic diphosphatase [Hyphomicrobium sp.]|uniref:inorganic diphosphatase n=1 Tax=Hyphomicrobium sp. TaxID=82 RepID=UPI0039E44C4D